MKPSPIVSDDCPIPSGLLDPEVNEPHALPDYSNSIQKPPDSDMPSIDCDQKQPSAQDDIGKIDLSTLTDDVKYRFISDRIPASTFQFPFKVYKDNRCKSGFFKRFVKFGLQNLTLFPTLSSRMGCIACKFFPDTSGRRPTKLVTEPYRNWKDATSDQKTTHYMTIMLTQL